MDSGATIMGNVVFNEFTFATISDFSASGVHSTATVTTRRSAGDRCSSTRITGASTFFTENTICISAILA